MLMLLSILVSLSLALFTILIPSLFLYLDYFVLVRLWDSLLPAAEQTVGRYAARSMSGTPLSALDPKGSPTIDSSYARYIRTRAVR